MDTETPSRRPVPRPQAIAARLLRPGAGRARLRAARRRAQAARRASALFDTRRAVGRLERGLRLSWDAAVADGRLAAGRPAGGSLAPAAAKADAAAFVAAAVAAAGGGAAGGRRRRSAGLERPGREIVVAER
jgi:hypothetical protein